MKKVPCPQCGTEVVWETAKFRPFCSERCRLIDLGGWLDERYRIPSDPTGGSTEDDEAAT